MHVVVNTDVVLKNKTRRELMPTDLIINYNLQKKFIILCSNAQKLHSYKILNSNIISSYCLISI